jgi:hypothetical protein
MPLMPQKRIYVLPFIIILLLLMGPGCSSGSSPSEAWLHYQSPESAGWSASGLEQARQFAESVRSGAGKSSQQSDIKALFNSFPQTDVLLLGTFHFKDAGLDSYKPEYDVDITSSKRQKELSLILEKLKQFNPDAIGLEFKPDRQETMDEKYTQYLNGQFQLSANEIYQIGFRLAAQLEHPKVFGVDARASYYSDVSGLSQKEYQEIERKYVQRLRDYDPEIKQWYPTYQKLYRYQDKVKKDLSLVEYFLVLNDPDNIKRSHGIYLVDSFKLGLDKKQDYFGADIKTAWYNRNLRILQNIYRMIAETNARRVFVLVGAGHLPILAHAVQSSPELKWIDVGSVLSN